MSSFQCLFQLPVWVQNLTTSAPPERKPRIFCKSWGRHLGVLPLFLKICSQSSCFEYHFVSPLPELSWDSKMLARVSAFPSLLRQFPVASVSRILLTPIIHCHLLSCSFCTYGCMHFRLPYCHFGEGLGQKQKSVGMFNLLCLKHYEKCLSITYITFGETLNKINYNKHIEKYTNQKCTAWSIFIRETYT